MTRVSDIDNEYIYFDDLTKETESQIRAEGYNIASPLLGRRVISIHKSGKTEYEILKDLIRIGVPFESHYKCMTGYAVEMILKNNGDDSEFLTCSYTGEKWITHSSKIEQ